MNILIIEDDNYKFNEVKNYIKKYNKDYEIFRAISTKSAFKCLFENKFDYIFLDMNFPIYDNESIISENGVNFLNMVTKVDRYNKLINKSKIILCSSLDKSRLKKISEDFEEVYGYIQYDSSVYLQNSFNECLK